MDDKKMTKAERKEAERRMIAEMDEAMKGGGAKTDASETDCKNEEGRGAMTENKAENPRGKGAPRQARCRRCGAAMENFTCPVCGYKEYVPMDEKKLKKIRATIGIICIAAFVVWLVVRSIRG